MNLFADFRMVAFRLQKTEEEEEECYELIALGIFYRHWSFKRRETTDVANRIM